MHTAPICRYLHQLLSVAALLPVTACYVSLGEAPDGDGSAATQAASMTGTSTSEGSGQPTGTGEGSVQPSTSTTSTTNTTGESSTSEGAVPTTEAPGSTTDTVESTGTEPGTSSTGFGSTLATNSTTEQETSAGSSSGDTSGTSEGAFPATCGNGVLEEGEVCDDGILNKPGDYTDSPETGTCSDTCERLNYCGDGEVWSNDEECDDGDQEPLDACDACQSRALLVFVSSATYHGDLGGLAGADAKCSALAQAAGLPGAYRAWLSNPDVGPAQRFEHVDLDPDIPYIDVKGQVVASSWSDLTSCSDEVCINCEHTMCLAHVDGIRYDENGQGWPEWFIWTSTRHDGNPKITPNFCNGWTTSKSSVFGDIGKSGLANALWSSTGSANCGLVPRRIYCFQQIELP